MPVPPSATRVAASGRRSLRSGSAAVGSPVILALALAACGGGGGGGGPGGGVDDGLIIGTPGGRPAAEIETGTLLRTASAGAGDGLGINLDNLRAFDDADGSTSGDDDPLATLDEGNEGLLARTLGTEDTDARVTREGDVITIDPDETRLCADDEGTRFDDGLPGLYAGDETDGDGALDDGVPSDCERLLADLGVRVDALSEDSGVVTYLFDREPVLAIGYSPGGAIYELRLAGVRRVLEGIAALDGGGGETVPATMRGTLRLSAQVLDDTEGAEIAELSLYVTEAIAIADDSGPTRISLEPSRVFAASTDAATGMASLSVDWGALVLVGESEDDSGDAAPPATSRVQTLSLGGLELEIEASEGSDAVTVREAGLGGVPLSVDVDGNSALELALETFGASIDESGAITFSSPLGLRLALDNLTGFFEDLPASYRASFEAAAPAGTRLSEQANGATRVDAGGPVTASLVETDDGGSTQVELSAGAGSCFGADGQGDGDSGLALRPLACD